MENKKSSFVLLLREVWRLLRKFFTSVRESHEAFEIPENLVKSENRLQLAKYGMELISVVFAFLLQATNKSIEARLVVLGIFLFMLYTSRYVIDDLSNLFTNAYRERNRGIWQDEVALCASRVLEKVSNKVLKYDKKTGTRTVMADESVLNSLKNYLTSLWEVKCDHKFQLLEFGNTMVTLVVVIVSNNKIPQVIFIPMVFLFSCISFLCSAFISINRREFYENDREANNAQRIILNDILRVPEIAIGKDTEMRIRSFQRTVRDSNANQVKFTNKKNLSNLVVSIIQLLSQFMVILLLVWKINLSNITVASIAEITANLVIVNTAFSNVGRLFRIIQDYSDRINTIAEEKPDIEKIMAVYDSEVSKKVEDVVREIQIPEFSIKYVEGSENDKPFTLVSKGSLRFNEGSIVILYGPSGSGKSTFMKLLTQRISVDNAEKIPSTSRFLFYDENLRFGSFDMFSELFCMTEEPDLEKMRSIMESLHLWQEIERSCKDVWRWMREKKFDGSLSNGQKQRMILAKMLYWLDENVDVLVLDESTSGLDENPLDSNSATATAVLEYIVRYANKDKKRTVVIATHQNIDMFVKSMMEDGFEVKSLVFRKSGKVNEIAEIT